MTVRVIYLGRLQDTAGRLESRLTSSLGDLSWSGFVSLLNDQVNSEIATAASDPSTKIALNGVLETDRGALVFRHGDEIALLPPVSGG